MTANEVLFNRLEKLISKLREREKMAANLKKTVKIKTDSRTGKARVVRTAAYDASKTRKIAKSKAKRVVSPRRARAAK